MHPMYEHPHILNHINRFEGKNRQFNSEQLYINKLSKLKEMHKSLETTNLPTWSMNKFKKILIMNK